MVFCSLLIAIEFGVRIIFPEIGSIGSSKNLFQAKRFGNSFGLTPNVKGYSAGSEVFTNDLGFRIDPTLPDPVGTHRVLVLGDSVSFGQGVKAGDTFPFILQKRLKDCKILNASVLGYDAEDYFNVLKSEIRAGLPFEGVILCICLRDFTDYSQALIQEGINKEQKIRYPNRFLRLLRYVTDNYVDFNGMLREHSRTYLLIKNLATDTAKNYFLADLATYDRDNINEIITNKLKRINDLARSNGKWLLFVIAPYEYQLRPSSFNDSHNLKPQKLINDIAVKEKWPVIDLLPFFKGYLDKAGQKSTSLYIFGDGVHFSVNGHRLAAQTILTEMGQHPINQNLN